MELKLDVKNIEFIPQQEEAPEPAPPPQKINPAILFILFAIAYLALDLWSDTGKLLIKTYISSNPSWKVQAFIALIVTIILVLVAYFSNVPFILFETL